LNGCEENNNDERNGSNRLNRRNRNSYHMGRPSPPRKAQLVKRYTVREGRHAFRRNGWLIIPAIRKKPHTCQWSVKFGEDSRYLLPFPDSRDWNKGGGVSFDLLTNHTDSAMWAWRYDAESGMFEIAAYHHVEGARVIAKNGGNRQDPETLFRIKGGETLNIYLRVNYETKFYEWTIWASTGRIFAAVPFTHRKAWTKSIGAWFGGTSAAPKDVTLEIKLL
jgi:hypothetical protein